MLQLHCRIAARWDDDPLVLRVCEDPGRAIPYRASEAFLDRGAQGCPDSFAVRLTFADEPERGASACVLPGAMSYLGDGDILRIAPRTGQVNVLYRRGTRSNSMLLTERCNSFCVMCSQPPKARDDWHLVDDCLRAISLMDPETPELGLTGGEPTLLGERLFEIIRACREQLPQTSLHMLSNGRAFQDLAFCEELTAIEHPDLVIGIPLYSDIAWEHDFVVQSSGAFDETLRGLMNLARCDLRIELRVVIHRHTATHLHSLARFIARNAPYVEHVAFMGLEPVGFGRTNLEALWIDPVEYQDSLAIAVGLLDRRGLNVSIYNHQLCTLNESLWPFARKSISDWKNDYLDVCDHCAVRKKCGGFFSSALSNPHARIQPISATAAEGFILATKGE